MPDLKTGERKASATGTTTGVVIRKIERLQEALAKIKHIAQFP
ncbi:MAG: hypothetical protein ACLSB9_33660 [Hydrogeniiclostridium mannosilyticum]